jgi:thiamine phosphate synthase YjbQ (UPF0047 family)
MAAEPSVITVNLSPSARYETIDIRERVEKQMGDVLEGHNRALYCSMHTTAGYLEHSVASRLLHRHDRLSDFVNAFRGLFPANGGYEHDRLEIRNDLTDEQRVVEPRNADSHLTFIGAGMRNCVTYRTDPVKPVYFIELDGVNEGTARQRTTRIVAYDEEQTVDRFSVEIPASRHAVDSINLATADTGLIERANERARALGVEVGRIDISLPGEEEHAGLTVNEFETLLMQHDLREVLRDPLRFAKDKSRHILEDPLAVPFKSLDYARYDLVHVFNSLVRALRIEESAVERLLVRLISVPARRFLRIRRSISFVVCPTTRGEVGTVARGTYQSPILLQWGPSAEKVRRLEVSLVRFR